MMANEEQLKILGQGVSAWNTWKQQPPKGLRDLSGATLPRADLREADLSETLLTRADLRGANLARANLTRGLLEETDLNGADLREADLSETLLTKADLRGANLARANLTRAYCHSATLHGADLRGANLHGTFFYRADLRETNLRGYNLRGRDLGEADLREADLRGADLRGADLRGATLTRADLSGTNLRETDLWRAHLRETNLKWSDLRGRDLRGADLREADLHGANFSGANLSGANLSGADLRRASLIEAILDGATLTEAWLWETQRSGWSVQGIICKAAYWDKDGKKRTTYEPKEFGRLYADNTKIMIDYKGGITPIEIATLPTLIQHLEAAHSGCVLRLQSIEDAPRGATVTFVVEDAGDGNPADLVTQLQESAKQLQEAQRNALEQADMRKHAEHALKYLSNEFFPKLLERAMERSGDEFHFYGPIGRDVLNVRDTARVTTGSTVTYTPNNLNKMKELVSDILTHREKLPLECGAQLDLIQEQLVAQVPNHSLLSKALSEVLHTLRHISEAGIAHVLVDPTIVGHWLPLLERLTH